MDEYRKEIEKLKDSGTEEEPGQTVTHWKLKLLRLNSTIALGVLVLYFLAGFAATMITYRGGTPLTDFIKEVLGAGVWIAPLAAALIIYFWNHREKKIIYLSYPTALEYKNHVCPDIDGIQCYNCKSRDIWSYPQSDGALHQCHQCHTWLYRT